MQNGESNHNVHPIADEVVGGVAKVGAVVVTTTTTATAAGVATATTAAVVPASAATAGAASGGGGVVGYSGHCAASVAGATGVAAVAIDGI